MTLPSEVRYLSLAQTAPSGQHHHRGPPSRLAETMRGQQSRGGPHPLRRCWRCGLSPPLNIGHDDPRPQTPDCRRSRKALGGYRAPPWDSRDVSFPCVVYSRRWRDVPPHAHARDSCTQGERQWPEKSGAIGPLCIPIVCLGVTSAVACTYGCDDARIALTRCALMDGVRGDRRSRHRA